MIEEKNKVTLEVNGYAYSGWKTAKINQGIEQLAGVFSLEVAELPDMAVINAGDECVLKIGNDVMITGYVDIVSRKYTSSTSAVNIQGRDKSGDLVDCSTPAKEWLNQRFESIATELIKPFGLSLKSQLNSDANGYQKTTGKQTAKSAGTGGGIIVKKATSTGETVHRLLEKLCKQQGALLISDRVGGLIVTRAGLNGKSNDDLVLGGNLKEFNFEQSSANVFSDITVKGQASGSQRVNLVNVGERTKAAATVKNNLTVKSASKRYRPLILQSEEQADSARCKRRAEWEAGTREAKSKKVNCKVQGWRQSNGELWAINTLVNIDSAYTDKSQDWVISNITYNIDNSGTTCDMTLYSPTAYDVLSDIPDKSSGTSQRLSLKTVKER